MDSSVPTQRITGQTRVSTETGQDHTSQAGDFGAGCYLLYVGTRDVEDRRMWQARTCRKWACWSRDDRSMRERPAAYVDGAASTSNAIAPQSLADAHVYVGISSNTVGHHAVAIPEGRDVWAVSASSAASAPGRLLSLAE